MRTNFRTPAGWRRTVSKYGGCVFTHKASGMAVMRTIVWPDWHIFRSDCLRDPRPYRTWMEAVQAAEQALQRAPATGNTKPITTVD